MTEKNLDAEIDVRIAKPMMVAGVMVLQTGSSGGLCVFNAWITKRTVFKWLK